MAKRMGRKGTYDSNPKTQNPHYPYTGERSDLDTPLLNFDVRGKKDPRDVFTVGHAVRGIQIFGGIGSGKSSGSGKTFALTYLKHGFGGVVLTAKTTELQTWIDYMAIAGRPRNDLVVFDVDSPHSFNPLEYESKRGEAGAATLNLTNLLMTMYEMGLSFTGAGSSGSERYWDDQLRMLISRMIDLLKLSGEDVSIMNMRRILTSAPDQKGVKEFKDLDENKDGELAKKIYASFLTSSQEFCLQCLVKAREAANSEQEKFTLELLESYFFVEWAGMSEKTRSIIESSFYGMIEPFMGSILRQYFTTGVSGALDPKETYQEGKVIVINFPVKEFGISGAYAQAIYKKIWQDALERRNTKTDPLPVFLYVDESQYFVNKHDTKFQTTARSARVCTVMITQNISNYYGSIGGKYPKENTDSLLGNLSTKIFHTQNDPVTNEWAARAIGKTYQTKQSVSANLSQDGSTTTTSEQLQFQVEPQEFTILKEGGAVPKVEGILILAGKQWSDGSNYIRITFDQNFTP